jgi:hypothetical protein
VRSKSLMETIKTKYGVGDAVWVGKEMCLVRAFKISFSEFTNVGRYDVETPKKTGYWSQVLEVLITRKATKSERAEAGSFFNDKL